MVTMVNPEKIKGLQITALPASTQGVINISRNESGNKANSQVLATIYLPQQLLIKAKGNKSGLQRITVFVFDNDRLFLNNISQSTSSKGKKTVSGKIVAISIKGTKLRNLSYDEQVQTTFSTPTATTESAADCVFWDFSGAGMLKIPYICVFGLKCIFSALLYVQM